MKRMSREVRKELILSYVVNNPHVSTNKLAKGVGMSNSPYFRKMLCELINEGKIGAVSSELKNKRKKYSWVDVRDIPF